MKIKLESGECLVVEVPVRFGTSTAITIQSEFVPPGPVRPPQRLIDVMIADGLIGGVNEHVVRRNAHADTAEDRLMLWGHLVSAHAGIFPLQATLEELMDMHEHEHNGPGTIRNHPRESREYSLKKIGKVLSESDQ